MKGRSKIWRAGLGALLVVLLAACGEVPNTLRGSMEPVAGQGIRADFVPVPTAAPLTDVLVPAPTPVPLSGIAVRVP